MYIIRPALHNYSVSGGNKYSFCARAPSCVVSSVGAADATFTVMRCSSEKPLVFSLNITPMLLLCTTYSIKSPLHAVSHFATRAAVAGLGFVSLARYTPVLMS